MGLQRIGENYIMRISMICTSLNIIWMIKLRQRKWMGHERERRVDYRVLVGEPVGKKPPRRPKHRWEGNIKMDLQEVGWGGMDLIGTGGRLL